MAYRRHGERMAPGLILQIGGKGLRMRVDSISFGDVKE